jgi:5'-nucleotidase
MILLVNDDGIASPGYRALYRALRRHTGEAVLAVAPAGERSGMGHAITLDRGLVVAARHEDGFFGFAIDGTPTDCTKLALDRICPERPRLVVSGINDGPNAGRSVHYSGTLGAAMEAAVDGLPAFAISRMRGWAEADDGADFAGRWAARLLGAPGLAGLVVNLNLPATPAAQWRPPRVAPHGRAGFRETYRPVREGGERHAWRLHGAWHAGDGDEDTRWLEAGHPVLSLLRPDLNAPDAPLRALAEGVA